jgi:hypothetical protein
MNIDEDFAGAVKMSFACRAGYNFEPSSYQNATKTDKN